MGGGLAMNTTFEQVKLLEKFVASEKFWLAY